jgi:DNA-binding MarR family transcriptional regulator
MVKKLKTLTKNELWTLLIVNHFSKHNGATIEDILREDKRKININLVDVVRLTKSLEEGGMISRSRFFQDFFKITEKGKETLNKESKTLKNSEFMDFLAIAPEEIVLGYRVHNIENTLLFGVLGGTIFRLSLFLISSNRIVSALTVFLVSVLAIGLAIGHLSNVLAIAIYNHSKNLKESVSHYKRIPRTIKKFLEVFSKIDYRVLLKIIGLVAMAIIFGIVNFLFYLRQPDSYESAFWGQVILVALWLIKKIWKNTSTNSNQIITP